VRVPTYFLVGQTYLSLRTAGLRGSGRFIRA